MLVGNGQGASRGKGSDSLTGLNSRTQLLAKGTIHCVCSRTPRGRSWWGARRGAVEGADRGLIEHEALAFLR